MKVDIKNRHERTGMLRKTDHYWVDVTVTFSEEEKQIITHISWATSSLLNG